MLKRILTVFIARNKEFYRDKAAFLWNIFFPLLIIVGFSFMFGNQSTALYKVGIVIEDKDSVVAANSLAVIAKYKQVKYTEFLEFKSKETAVDKLLHHKIDLLLIPDEKSYSINRSSPKGYISEKMLHYSQIENNTISLRRELVSGREIPYVEWLFPGILAMNMMFAALFGVGFVIVRYRKNGVLKRFSVTPIRAWEFLTAQVLSRIFLMMISTTLLFVVVILMYKFEVRGSYLDLFIFYFLGAISMISIGLVVAARLASEELCNGVLNLISWPMMFFSEVWFSLEGASEWVKSVSKFFPLTYIVDGTRQIMNDGATLYELRYYALALIMITLACMTIGSLLFRWNQH